MSGKAEQTQTPLSLSEQSKHVAETKIKIKKLEADLKSVKNEYAERRTELLQTLAEEGVRQVKVDTSDGDRLLFVRRIYGAHVTDADKFDAWCKQNQMSARTFMMWSFKKMQAFMKDHLDEGTPLPDGVEGWDGLDISVRK